MENLSRPEFASIEELAQLLCHHFNRSKEACTNVGPLNSDSHAAPISRIPLCGRARCESAVEANGASSLAVLSEDNSIKHASTQTEHWHAKKQR